MRIKTDLKRLAKCSIGTCGLVAMVGGGLAFGQDDVVKEADEAAPKKAKSEKIRVTGSRIKRTDSEGVSPVLVLDREKIERSGASSISELLNNLSISSNGSYSASVVNDSRGTVTNVNLRGLGAGNTLVLLDGRRMPDEGGLGVIDLSTIPMAAVERIEVLKDSASAIYGSDATGGVVNVITRKDLDGSVVSVHTSQPYKLKGGQQTDVSYVTGVNKKDFRMTSILTYRKVAATFYRDRDWTKEGLSTYSFPANWQLEGVEGAKLTAHDNCEVPEKDRILYDGQLVCPYNYGAASAFSPESTSIGFLNNMEYELNNGVTVHTSVRTTKATNLWNMAPNAGDFKIPQGVALTKREELGLPLTEVPGDVTVRYRGLPWGNREWQEEKTTIGANAGLKGSFNNTWDWDFTAGHTESKKDVNNPKGFFLKRELVNGISEGKFNPFATNLSGTDVQGVINRASYTPFEVITSDANTYNFDVTGELGQFESGPLGLAVGVSRLEQGFSRDIDTQSEQGEVFGVEQNEDGAGTRDINAAYVELSVPVTSDLEVQLAARHDVYNDFGSTTNPKLGFKWLATPGLLVRGGAGTGFKAPSLSELYKGNTVTLPNVVDTPRGDDEPTTEIRTTTRGNKDLQEETSVTYTLGLVAAPFAGFSLSFDYWYIKINDVVKAMEAQDVADAYAAGNGAQLEEYGIKLDRGTDPNGVIRSFDIPTLNLGTQEDSGIDLNLNYGVRLGADYLGFDADYSRKIYAKSTPYPGAPVEDTLGERGEPRWRTTLTGTYTLDNAHSFSLRNNQIGKMESRNDEDLTISQFSTYDVQYSWQHPWDGSVALGALNVLNKDFPRDPTERGGDDQRVADLYSPNGTTVFVKAEQVF